MAALENVGAPWPLDSSLGPTSFFFLILGSNSTSQAQAIHASYQYLVVAKLESIYIRRYASEAVHSSDIIMMLFKSLKSDVKFYLSGSKFRQIESLVSGRRVHSQMHNALHQYSMLIRKRNFFIAPRSQISLILHPNRIDHVTVDLHLTTCLYRRYEHEKFGNQFVSKIGISESSQ